MAPGILLVLKFEAYRLWLYDCGWIRKHTDRDYEVFMRGKEIPNVDTFETAFSILKTKRWKE